MQKDLLKLKIKQFFNQKLNIKMGQTARYFLVGVGSSLLTVLVLVLLVLNFRADIFGYFANEYIKSSVEVEEPNKIVQAIDQEIKPVDLAQEIIQNKVVVASADEQQENTVIDTVKKTNPAVVSIIITKEVPKYEVYNDPNQNYNPFGGLLPGFNFSIPQYRQNGTEKKEVGGGSGFFVSADGLIVTNRHVVNADNVEYTVYTNDGKKYKAQVVARDQVYDLALIKVSGSSFPYLRLGNSDNLEVGQTVIAIGNALAEFKNSVSVGVISGLSRSITAGGNAGAIEFLDNVIQTDAAINPGNSGGPLLNLAGEVVGVNVAVAQGSENIGFALPINSVRSAIDSVRTTGKIVRPYLGIRYVAINPEIKAKNNLTVDYGVLIKSGTRPNDFAVLPGSPADKAGLVEGDIILEIDGVKIEDGVSLASVIRGKKIGETVRLRVLHNGLEKTIFLRLESAQD